MSRLALAAGVVAALLAPAAVVLAQPAPPTATLPPIRRVPGQQVGDAGAPRTPDAGAPAVSPAPAASSSTSAGPASRSATGSPGAPPPPPPGYGYPPPGYGYPPPGYGYPPPGYGYPPPGYDYPPPGYDYSPPASAREQPHKPKRPPHDAAQASPFIDALAGVVVEGNRFADPLAVGGEAGLFVAGRLRISARFLLLPDHADDNNSWSSDTGYERQPSKSPSFVWGGTVGFAVASKPSFLLSPGLLFMRSNVGDYGSVLALDVPFEWVWPGGLRMGFDVALGRAFGGTFIERCYSYGYSASNLCTGGTTREIDRDPGATFYASYEIGWGWHH